MCYVGQVCKVYSFFLVVAVVGVVIFGFVWLGHHQHHDKSDQGEITTLPPCTSTSDVNCPNANPNPNAPPSPPNFVPLSAGAPPPLTGRPFISAYSPSQHG